MNCQSCDMPFYQKDCGISPDCSLSTPFKRTVKGYAKVTRETRSVSGFTGVDFQATGDVSIRMGDEDSVVIEAAENILPLLKTEVIGSQLIISERADTEISDRSPMRFTITTKKLESASMSGTGDININGVDADLLKFDLAGTGTITAHGKVKTLIVSLPGMGFLICDGLEADRVIADHNGIGEILVRAEHSLNAEITGVGAIKYYGDPANIVKAVTGYGKIYQLPQ